MIRFVCSAVILSILVLLPVSAHADSVELLTFQGLGDLQAVGNFYNGAGPLNTPNYGITFSSNFFGLRAIANGGAGNFAGTPTGMPAVFITNSLNGGSGAPVTGIMNVAPGFSNGLNFFYTAGFAANQNETVTVWSGVNGTGTVLATINLANNNANCTSPLYCSWTDAGLSFSGTAHSVTFKGPSNEFGFSDITVGSSITAVPEPSSFFLLGAGLVAISIGSMRRFFRV